MAIQVLDIIDYLRTILTQFMNKTLQLKRIQFSDERRILTCEKCYNIKTVVNNYVKFGIKFSRAADAITNDNDGHHGQTGLLAHYGHHHKTYHSCHCDHSQKFSFFLRFP